MDVLPTGQNLGAKTQEKCCRINIFEGVVFWPLASNVKAQRTNFCSQPIKLLKFFVCLTDGPNVKRPNVILRTIT
jgi:hypothetical protein